MEERIIELNLIDDKKLEASLDQSANLILKLLKSLNLYQPLASMVSSTLNSCVQ